MRPVSAPVRGSNAVLVALPLQDTEIMPGPGADEDVRFALAANTAARPAPHLQLLSPRTPW